MNVVIVEEGFKSFKPFDLCIGDEVSHPEYKVNFRIVGFVDDGGYNDVLCEYINPEDREIGYSLSDPESFFSNAYTCYILDELRDPDKRPYSRYEWNDSADLTLVYRPELSFWEI